MNKKIVTMSPGFPALTRIFSEMEKLGLSAHYNGMNEVNPDAFQIWMLGAWWPGAGSAARGLKNRGNRVFVLWTSPILQSELSVAEIPYYAEIKSLLDNGTIEYVLCGSKDACEVFGDKARFIQYPLTLRPIPEVEILKGNVGLFGPIHGRKNILNQMLALKGGGYVLHVTQPLNEYKSFAKTIGLEVVEHGWLPEEEYYKLVASMEFGLQCSIPGVESFGYSSFDFLMMDRLVLSTSTWTPWGGNTSYSFDDIRLTTTTRSFPSYTQGILRDYAEKVAKENNAQFKKVLESVV